MYLVQWQRVKLQKYSYFNKQLYIHLLVRDIS